MSGAPAFQFYPHDFLAGRVATYSLEAVGAYIVLLSFDWSLNGLPNAVEKLAKICRVSSRRFANIWLEIADQFPLCDDGKLHNPRLENERAKQLAYSQRMAENGRRGGRPRKPMESRGLADGKPNESTPSPTPSPITTKASAQSWTARFADIWSARVGHVAPGHVGRALKEAYVQHGPERLERAMLGYIAMRQASNQPLRISWFAKEATVWVGQTTGALDVVDGEMTDTLELLTRPARAS